MEFASSMFPYGDLWRRHRKVFQQNFRKDAIGKYEDIVISKVGNMLRSLMDSPEGFVEHYKSWVFQFTMCMDKPDSIFSFAQIARCYYHGHHVRARCCTEK